MNDVELEQRWPQLRYILAQMSSWESADGIVLIGQWQPSIDLLRQVANMLKPTVIIDVLAEITEHKLWHEKIGKYCIGSGGPSAKPLSPSFEASYERPCLILPCLENASDWLLSDIKFLYEHNRRAFICVAGAVNLQNVKETYGFLYRRCLETGLSEEVGRLGD